MTNKEIMKKLIVSQSNKATKVSYEIESEKFEFTVKPVISFTKRMQLVNEIINLVVDNTTNTLIDYNPATRKFAQRYAIIKYFTDINLPKNADDVWLLLTQTQIYEDTIAIVGEDIDDIIKEADSGINALVEQLTRKSNIQSMLNKLIDNAEFGATEGGEILGQVVELFKKIPNMSQENIVNTILTLNKNKNNN